MKMLKSKNIRRICVLFAMLAPVVYLFGSLFSALTGSHGVNVFADTDNEHYVETLNVERGVAFDNETGAVVPGYYASQYAVAQYVEVSSNRSYTFSDFSGYSTRLYKYNTDYSFIESQANVVVFDGFDGFVRLYIYSPEVVVETVKFTVAGDNVPASVDAEAYSDYVFGQFFAKDNFLVQIGKDVLSETPHGFVPFASFWKYLDENMLHMGNMQLGLMGYGYVYYCCHVLLFDIAFILVTFFLDFIQKVNDKIVGGVD